MKPSTPLPWAQMMAFGFGKLKLSPAQFWSMSLPEMASAMRWYAGDAAAPMTQETLQSLLTQFPDTEDLAHG